MSLNPKLRDWRGKTVWLIGASSGIGRALAVALHQAGAQVIVSARQQGLLQAFTDSHPGAQAIALDVMDEQALAQACEAIVQRQGQIDLCVYCAGYFKPLTAQDFSLAEAQRHLDINYGGALKLLAALLPQLHKQAAQGQGGHLSLISSVAGYRGLPRSLAYGPSKAALTHLAEALYLELSASGLGVSVIHPGFVATPMTAQNDFPMPALISPEQAAQATLDGWAQGQFEIHFPKRFTRVLKVLRHLSDGLYFRLIRRITKA